MKRKLLALLVLSFFVIITGCSASNEPVEDKTAQQIAEESFDKWYGIDSYNMDLSMNMKMSMGSETVDISMAGQATVFQNPMKMKMVLDTTIPGMDQNMQITQYMVEEDQIITIYQQLEDQWYKTVVDDPAMSQMMQMDPRENMELFMDNLIQAEIVSEEKVGERDTYKIDLLASSEIFDQLLEDMTNESLGLNSEMLGKDLFSKIGDMKYTVWIDKDTLETVKCYMDLTDNMRNLGNAMAEDQDAPEELKEVFSNMEMSMEYTILNHNNALDFTVPDEAKNAKELPMN